MSDQAAITTAHRAELGDNVHVRIIVVCVASGRRVGEGAIVGMGTVVLGEVAALAMVASQPGRVVGHREGGGTTDTRTNWHDTGAPVAPGSQPNHTGTPIYVS